MSNNRWWSETEDFSRSALTLTLNTLGPSPMTTDDALDTLTTTLVYGIFHDGASDDQPMVDSDLIYIGATRDPLSRRMDYHRNHANRGKSSPIHTYMREEVDNPIEDLSIEELPYDSEQAALDALGDVTLNVDPPTPGNWYPWTWEKVDALITTIEEENLAAAQRALDANATQVRNAALRLGLIEPRGYTRIDWDEWDDQLGTMSDADLADKIGCSTPAVSRRRRKLDIEAFQPKSQLTDDQVLEVWIRYHLDDDATYPSVADAVEFEASEGTVARIMREETYTHVDRPSPVAIRAADAYNDAHDAALRQSQEAV